MTRALFFDFDGTIVDTESPELELWRETFARFGQEYPDAHWRHIVGRGADLVEESAPALLRRLMGPGFEPPDVHEELMVRIARQPIRPGVTSLLDAADAVGVRLAVVSSSKRAWVEGHLRRVGLWDRFEQAICSEDAPRPKPHPDLYVAAMDHFGLGPDDVRAIEDSPNGYAAATGAGIATIVTPNPATALLDFPPDAALVSDLAAVTLDAIYAKTA